MTQKLTLRWPVLKLAQFGKIMFLSQEGLEAFPKILTVPFPRFSNYCPKAGRGEKSTPWGMLSQLFQSRFPAQLQEQELPRLPKIFASNLLPVLTPPLPIFQAKHVGASGLHNPYPATS